MFWMMNGLLIAGALSNFCNDAHQILGLVGWVLTVFKIAIPLIIIALGLIDLGKAAVSSKPEEIKKCATSLVYRLVGGIAIFFVPTIIMIVFGWISGWDKVSKEVGWDTCYTCITGPWSEKCTNAPSNLDIPTK